MTCCRGSWRRWPLNRALSIALEPHKVGSSTLLSLCCSWFALHDWLNDSCGWASSGLAEVMAGLGVEKLDKLMPDVVQTASKVDIASHVRDGYIMMFIYLPLTFGDRFTPYVGPIIPCILKVLLCPHRVFLSHWITFHCFYCILWFSWDFKMTTSWWCSCHFLWIPNPILSYVRFCIHTFFVE